MFEILARDGWGRIGSWSQNGTPKKVETPTLASIDSDRFPKLSNASLLISRNTADEFVPSIVSLGSRYSPKEVKDSPMCFAILPTTYNYPLTFPVPVSDDEVGKLSGSNAFTIDGSSVPFTKEDIGDRELITLSDAGAYATNPRLFASMVTTIRGSVGYQRLLYTPALGEPADYALLSYLGIDLFDDIALLMATRRGELFTGSGKMKLADIDKNSMIPCSCTSCAGKTTLTYDDLLKHNRNVAFNELMMVKHTIRNGTLRELVESRASTSTTRMSLLRAIDAYHYHTFERHAPVRRTQSLMAVTHESLHRPEVVRFRERFKQRYEPPDGPKVLLLLPCSSRKPYSSSPSHRKFREVIHECSNPSLVHEVMVTSPLGIVPRELEYFYPAMHYDIPVIGHWYPQEKEIIKEQLESLMNKGSYTRVICHLGSDSEFLFDTFSEMERSSQGHPTSYSALRSLRDNLESAIKAVEISKKVGRKLEDIKSLARFQFTKAGERLLEDSYIAGSRFNRKVFSKREMVASLSSNKGTLSLTLKGGKVLAKEETYRVHIEDFLVKGNLFAIGVTGCDDEVRIGDDVVIVHGDEVRGVGRADMSAGEMIDSKRGKAVDVRHSVKGA